MKLGEDLGQVACFLAMAFAVSDCEWTELDAIAPGASDDARAPDASGPTKVRDASIDASNAVDASNAPPDTAACTSAETTLYQWTFDSDVQSWGLMLDTDVKATLSWTDSRGKPSPGAIKVEITPVEEDGGALNGGWLKYPHAFQDLTRRTVSAWVWLESGESPNLKVFAQTGSQYAWSDNGTVHLQPRTWTCVSLPLSTPSYNQPDYDPTDVIALGFELLGRASFQVYVDTVRVY